MLPPAYVVLQEVGPNVSGDKLFMPMCSFTYPQWRQAGAVLKASSKPTSYSREFRAVVHAMENPRDHPSRSQSEFAKALEP